MTVIDFMLMAALNSLAASGTHLLPAFPYLTAWARSPSHSSKSKAFLNPPTRKATSAAAFVSFLKFSPS